MNRLVQPDNQHVDEPASRNCCSANDLNNLLLEWLLRRALCTRFTVFVLNPPIAFERNSTRQPEPCSNCQVAEAEKLRHGKKAATLVGLTNESTGDTVDMDVPAER